MEELLEYISKNFGKAISPQCNHCKLKIRNLHACGNCYQAVYCSKSCQENDWSRNNMHYMICKNNNFLPIGGRSEDDPHFPKKRKEREEDEIDSTKKEKREIDPRHFPQDVIRYIGQFLEGEDLKNFSAATRHFTRALRQDYFGRFRFKIDEYSEEYLFFNETVPYIQAVLIDNKEVETLLGLLQKLPLLKDIKFGHNFNKPVDALPAGLTHLTFGFNFNQAVDALPAGLTHLTFGNDFNKPVDALPAGLTHLTFGRKFNQEVNFLYLKNLTHLTFGNDFSNAIDALPFGLTHLTFGSNFDNSVEVLPATLTHLTFGHKFNGFVDDLPPGLTHLTFRGFFNKFDQPVDRLPPGLTHLDLGWKFNGEVDNLPVGLTHLTFGEKFDQPVNLLYLENLTHLSFRETFKQPVHGLPRGLTHLQIPNRYRDQNLFFPPNTNFI